MYYTINVSLDGAHMFATAPRSITTKEKCAVLLDLFLILFPKERKYHISVSYTPEKSCMADVTSENSKAELMKLLDQISDMA